MASKGVSKGAFTRKDPFANLQFVEEANRKENRDFGLYAGYQINPFTLATMDYVTPKITERRPPQCVLDRYLNLPEYQVIKDALKSRYDPPMKKYPESRTEMERYGWFPAGKGYFDKENYDDRFLFTHSTPDFIKTKASLRKYDQLMNPKKV